MPPFAKMAAQTTEPSPLATQIGTLLADPKVEGAHWGISVTQMDGTPIYALHDDQLFQPESNVKLFTTAAALDLLGSADTRKTTLTAVGRPTGTGTVSGTVVINGHGDAYLSDAVVPYDGKANDTPPSLARLDALAASLAEQLKKKNITTIDGEVVARTTFSWQNYAPGWNQDDLLWGFAAPVTGVVVNDNQLQLTVTPGKTLGSAVALTLTPAMPAYYMLDNRMTTGGKKTATHITLRRTGRTLTVFGTIAMDTPRDTEQVAIDDPALYAVNAIKMLLAQHGIQVTGEAAVPSITYDGMLSPTMMSAPIDLKRLRNSAVQENGSALCEACGDLAEAEHVSPTLLEDVTLTNKLSLNLHAELLLRRIGALPERDGGSNFAQGARVIRQFAIDAGVQPDDFYFVDGSGLSTYDIATPRAFTQLLRFATTQPWGAEYKASLPIGGVDGTLQDRFTKAPLKGNVFAKTGTSSEDRALSGYVVCASGRTAVFSILVGDHLPGSNADRDVMDKIVAAIAAAN